MRLRARAAASGDLARSSSDEERLLRAGDDSLEAVGERRTGLNSAVGGLLMRTRRRLGDFDEDDWRVDARAARVEADACDTDTFQLYTLCVYVRNSYDVTVLTSDAGSLSSSFSELRVCWSLA